MQENKYTKQDFSASILSKQYDGCEFIDCNFENVILSNITFMECKFTHCNFNINPEINNIKKAQFSSENIQGLLNHLDIIIR